jgi:hypothetical protein
MVARIDVQKAPILFRETDERSGNGCKCPTLHVLSLGTLLVKPQSEGLVPQLLVLTDGFKLISAIKVL